MRLLHSRLEKSSARLSFSGHAARRLFRERARATGFTRARLEFFFLFFSPAGRFTARGTISRGGGGRDAHPGGFIQIDAAARPFQWGFSKVCVHARIPLCAHNALEVRINSIGMRRYVNCPVENFGCVINGLEHLVKVWAKEILLEKKFSFYPFIRWYCEWQTCYYRLLGIFNLSVELKDKFENFQLGH